MFDISNAVNKNYCYIFGAAPISTPLKIMPSVCDFIIAADAGLNFLLSQEIKPNLLVGDFDSLGYVPNDTELVRFPTVKDDTDMMLAINEGIKRGYTNFIIYGGMGGKLEFTLANLQILYNIVNIGCSCYFVDNSSLVTAVKNGKIGFDENFRGRISVFAGGSAAYGVTIQGLKYTLFDGVLKCDNPLGVSNEFIGERGYISVKDGIVYIIYDNCNGMFLPYIFIDT